MSVAGNFVRKFVPPRTREAVLRQLNRARSRFLPEPYRSVLPYTMVGLDRLRKLDELARAIDQDAIKGDIVECGTCNGGSGAILARVACRSPHERHTWLLDSFAGLPAAGEKDGPFAAEYTGLCCGRMERVREVLERMAVPKEAVTLVPGWFQESLPHLPVERIALLHIDADWYDSVLTVLQHLYDKVVPGGYVVFDDFGYWEGCRRACEEFLAARGINVALTIIDGIGAYFRKPHAPESDSPR
jgi:O-methyltransferase